MTNFRKQIYTAYKAHRPPMPPELAEQLGMVRHVIELFGLTQLEVPGFEADDIIATLTGVARAAGMDVVICSSDKDLTQLCGDGVAVLDTMRNKMIGPAEVQEKFGVPPDRVGDVLALMGDSIDNVPGVAGIGPKTAAELINRFGSLEALLAAGAEEIKGKRGTLIVESRDAIRVSRELVRLREDVPLPKTLDELHRIEPDKQRLGELFRELEMTRLIDQLSPTGAAAIAPRAEKAPPPVVPESVAPVPPPPPVAAVTERADLEALVADIHAAGRGRAGRAVRRAVAGARRSGRHRVRAARPPRATCRSRTATWARPAASRRRRRWRCWRRCWRRPPSPSTRTTPRRWRCCCCAAG